MQSNVDGGAVLALGADNSRGHGKGSGQTQGPKGQGWGQLPAEPLPGPAIPGALGASPGPSRSIPLSLRGPWDSPGGFGKGRTAAPMWGLGFHPRGKGAAPRGTPNPCSAERDGAEREESREKEPGEVGAGGEEGRAPHGRHEPRAAPGGRGAPVPPSEGSISFTEIKVGMLLIRTQRCCSSADPPERRGPRGPSAVLLGRDDVFVPLQSCCLFSARGKCCYPPLPSPAPSRFDIFATFQVRDLFSLATVVV